MFDIRDRGACNSFKEISSQMDEHVFKLLVFNGITSIYLETSLK